MKKKVLAAVLSSAIFCGTMQASASSNFFADVPVDDWSYTAVNDLIKTGHITSYTQTIPEGRIMSRLEMAMIVDEAMGNLDAFTPEEQETLKKLNEEYFFDIKKVRLINKINAADEEALNEEPQQKQTEPDFTPEEKDKLKNLVDRFSFDGYVRFRNDHFLTDKARTTRANMVHLQVATHYKINDNWQATLDMGYRNSLSGFDKTNNLYFSDNGENDTGFKMDTYVTGKMLDNALTVKAGKWNEWNPFGWGMDIDCDFAGAQFTIGKKDFKTFFTAGKMDLWDNAMQAGFNGVKDYNGRDSENVTSLRFFYPFSKKADINFGTAWTSPMASRYQNTSQHRIFSYYTHAHYKFDSNWDVRAGVINSNSHRADTEVAGTKTKKPGRWLQLMYKEAKLDTPGSYSITADYRYEPALNWVTVTDWCGLNEKFFRLGVAWVPAKNVMLDTFYTWAREIDTDSRDDLFRFQAQFFF